MNQTKYGIKHKITGKYFTARLGGINYYQDYPKTDIKEYWDTMTEANLTIISLDAANYLEVFLHKFD